MKEKNKKIVKFVLFVFILVGLTIILWEPISKILGDVENTKEFVQSFGIIAPLIFIFIVILQVLFAPIPGQMAGLAGGYIFGVLKGTIYSMVGLIIGSLIVFLLAKRLGRPFVERVVKKETLKKFDKLISKKGLPVLFLIYLLPAFPDDSISYLAGLTKIKLNKLVLVSALGRLPGFIVLSLVGAGIASKDSLISIIVFTLMMILSFLIYLNKEKFEKTLKKNANKNFNN